MSRRRQCFRSHTEDKREEIYVEAEVIMARVKVAGEQLQKRRGGIT